MDLSQFHFLIIDDDAFTCDLILRMLSKNGAQMIESLPDGKKAVARIEAIGKQPDIIICDLNMPEMDGIEFVHYLVQELYMGGIILISGSDRVILNAVKKLASTHFLNVLGFLEKPFTPESLITMLADFKKKE
jgi:CheY-like chemotaxis protein